MCFWGLPRVRLISSSFSILQSTTNFSYPCSVILVDFWFLGQTRQTHLTCCWAPSALCYDESIEQLRQKFLSADATVTEIVRRILNQCYYVGTIQLPQNISTISIARDYEAVLLFMATAALHLAELLSFRINVILPSNLVPVAFNTSSQNDRKNLNDWWVLGTKCIVSSKKLLLSPLLGYKICKPNLLLYTSLIILILFAEMKIRLLLSPTPYLKSTSVICLQLCS